MADSDNNGRSKQAIPDEDFVPGPQDEISEVDDAGFDDDEDVDAVGDEREEGDDSVEEV